jgi:hypothetical protein
MLSLIWSILNVVLIAVAFITFYRNKNKECVSFSKKVGTMCYSCSDEIEDNDPMDTYKRIVDDKEDFRLCKACDRDEKLGYFIYGNNKDQKINKFKKFLLSNKFRKIHLTILILIPLTLSLHYFLLFVYKIDGFQILNYLIVTIFWIVFLYKNKLEYKKK